MPKFEDDGGPVVIRLGHHGFEDVEPVIVHLTGRQAQDRSVLRTFDSQARSEDTTIEITVISSGLHAVEDLVVGLGMEDIVVVKVDPDQ